MSRNINRRDVIRIGGAGLFGTAPLLARIGQAATATQPGAKSADKGVSLIILFTRGGMSHLDTLDLKPEAPAEFRGEFRPIDTSVPGMQISEHLPLLARQADKFAILRSMTHGNSGHGLADHYMLTGYHPTPAFNQNLTPNNERPCHGAIIARKLGPRNSVPPYVALPMQHPSGGSAYLGSSAAPFVVNSDPNSPDFAVPDLAPPLEIQSARLGDRQRLFAQIDRYRQTVEVRANRRAHELSAFQQKAFDLMTSPETKVAFDIDREPKQLRDKYGRHSLGQMCLMARRLVEAGVRCTILMHNDWDTHVNNFHVLKNTLLPCYNSGIAALLEDLADRRLLETTMVLCMGEFGRTPRVNQSAGRDHWGPANSLLLAGGGIRGGNVVGKTNPNGEKPDGNPASPEDLAATIYRCLGIDGSEHFYTTEGRPVPIVNGGRAIEDLL